MSDSRVRIVQVAEARSSRNGLHHQSFAHSKQLSREARSIGSSAAATIGCPANILGCPAKCEADMNGLKSIVKRARRALNPIRVTLNSQEQPVTRSFGLYRGTPIDRRYIEQFLAKNRNSIHGDLIEVGEDRYSSRLGENVNSISLLSGSQSSKYRTIAADLTVLESLPAEQCDCFICTQTLNFIFDVQRAVHGLRQILKPGGVALCTVSGASQISRYDMNRWGDYWRFTEASLTKLFEPVFKNSFSVEGYGNLLAATSLLSGISVEDLPDPFKLDRYDHDYPITLGVVAVRSVNHPVADAVELSPFVCSACH